MGRPNRTSRRRFKEGHLRAFASRRRWTPKFGQPSGLFKVYREGWRPATPFKVSRGRWSTSPALGISSLPILTLVSIRIFERGFLVLFLAVVWSALGVILLRQVGCREGIGGRVLGSALVRRPLRSSLSGRRAVSLNNRHSALPHRPRPASDSQATDESAPGSRSGSKQRDCLRPPRHCRNPSGRPLRISQCAKVVR